MRSLSIALIAIAAVCASASPAPPPPMMPSDMGGPPPPGSPGPPAGPKNGEEASVMVASVGTCSQDCWNESAESAGCDPNSDDDCLCGPFFDAVTSCTSQTCSIGDNLQILNTLEPLCS
ncbi:hypothetical protein GRF29_69g596791 [Pseudopithomyces chartarum]|uniref:CFEM domain-containing protein n=1 Tax=Pseudopithomyces chartarum TaxID=1892770 RepID=A0AAN6LXP0_9PLEO|nr:hypothetical protein GRF29_69g596791 [Pseudopithomyces chartarum]